MIVRPKSTAAIVPLAVTLLALGGCAGSDRRNDAAHENYTRADSALSSSIGGEEASYRKMRPPKYPPNAARSGTVGIVYVRVAIRSDGYVDSATVEQLLPETATDLAKSAVDSILAWQFNPLIVHSKPVASQVIVPIEFKLEDVSPFRSAPSLPAGVPVLDPINVTGGHIICDVCEPADFPVKSRR